MSRKIYVVGGHAFYANWLKGSITKDMEDADIVLFTGGEDVSPALYGEPKGSRTFCSPSRDARELQEWKVATSMGKPIIGICRGSQLACVLSGGRLVQDQSNPNYIHPMHTSDGRIIMVTSTHHQAQYPYDMPSDEYKVLDWTEKLSPRHLNGNDEEISKTSFKEVEIAYYPKTKALAIQSHPEEIYGEALYDKTFEYLDEVLEKFLENKL